MVAMQQEIVEEFLARLEADQGFPSVVVKELRRRWQSGEPISKEEILDLIKRGGDPDGEDKGD